MRTLELWQWRSVWVLPFTFDAKIECCFEFQCWVRNFLLFSFYCECISWAWRPKRGSKMKNSSKKKCKKRNPKKTQGNFHFHAAFISWIMEICEAAAAALPFPLFSKKIFSTFFAIISWRKRSFKKASLNWLHARQRECVEMRDTTCKLHFLCPSTSGRTLLFF